MEASLYLDYLLYLHTLLAFKKLNRFFRVHMLFLSGT
jgi:hypothetical protein